MIVGVGFGGVYLHHCRKSGYCCKIFEAGSGLGRTWYWNYYPGARADSQVPVYECSIPEVWKNWIWTEAELRAYFNNVLDIKKDVRLETHVTEADYDTMSVK